MNDSSVKNSPAGLASAPEPSTVLNIRIARQRDVVDGYRILGSYGWGDDGAGHISARDPEYPDCFWMLRYGVAFRAATVEDLILLAPDGSTKATAGPTPNDTANVPNPAGFLIHHAVHAARPDVVSVVHTHTGYGTPFAALCRPLAAMSQEACAFHGDQAVFDGEELDIVDRDAAHRLGLAIGASRLLVLGNHGLLTVGPTVAQAVGFFLLAERAAEVQVKCPNGRVISDAAAAKVYESVGSPASGEEVFGWLKRSRLDR
jgi:ribulose-5-phosphate 4-epimerase/fuculose-1-phosphate aldolase